MFSLKLNRRIPNGTYGGVGGRRKSTYPIVDAFLCNLMHFRVIL